MGFEHSEKVIKKSDSFQMILHKFLVLICSGSNQYLQVHMLICTQGVLRVEANLLLLETHLQSTKLRMYCF